MECHPMKLVKIITAGKFFGKSTLTEFSEKGENFNYVFFDSIFLLKTLIPFTSKFTFTQSFEIFSHRVLGGIASFDGG